MAKLIAVEPAARARGPVVVVLLGSVSGIWPVEVFSSFLDKNPKAAYGYGIKAISEYDRLAVSTLFERVERVPGPVSQIRAMV